MMIRGGRANGEENSTGDNEDSKDESDAMTTAELKRTDTS
jgi:hypothetical protein